MKKIYLLFTLLVIGVADLLHAQTTIPIFDNVLFFDGYATRVDTPPAPAGVIRQRNDLYSVKLTDQQLGQIGTSLRMNVTIKASCDNYDRIGNVNLAFVPKGDTTYHPDSVRRIEIARYITPFMNKNLMPDTVPYTYDIANVAHLLKETSITTDFDIWVELQVFGVPYAANNEVAGCAGRNDVFYGSLDFVTNGTLTPESNNVLMPLNFQKELNNYTAGASDSVGLTRRTITFNVDQDLTDAVFVLITSNHGANSGGEEYNRRQHFAYFDGNEVLTYKPGRTSCEPFRVYNTQGNGIYGPSPRTNAQWQSFSNWCPGDVIDTRIIPLGPVTSGSHTFVINVPSAQFVGQQGYFPVSLYLQGKTSGNVPVPVSIKRTDESSNLEVYPNPAQSQLTIKTEGTKDPKATINIKNILGQTVLVTKAPETENIINISHLPAGMYTLVYESQKGNKYKKVLITK
ncbi:MAG: T9SS type A sorting domain-containing protein [Flavobacteriales bacterium]|nr:MAG: T9SS type A sorting domain-containing protein [Flavobacteriales bacterium]